MSKEQTDLAACPFCGGDASAEGVVRYSDRHVNEQGWEQNEFYYCNCPRCGVNNCGIVGHSSREKAIAAWNRRASPSPAGGVQAVTDEMAIRLLSIRPFGDATIGKYLGLEMNHHSIAIMKSVLVRALSSQAQTTGGVDGRS